MNLGKIVILYKDRLLKFGFELIEYIVSCKLQEKRANKVRNLVKELISKESEVKDKNDKGNKNNVNS